MGAFKEAHGGTLVDCYLEAEAAEIEKQAAQDYASWDLSERQLCDIELILNGAFSPLDGFLNQDDWKMDNRQRTTGLKSRVQSENTTMDNGQQTIDY